MRTEIKISMLIVLSVLIVSCGHKKAAAQKSEPIREEKSKPKKKTPTVNFQAGVPIEIQGEYYRYVAEPKLSEGDSVYELKFTKQTMNLNEPSAVTDNYDQDKICYHKLADGLYMLLENDYSFQKVRILPNKNLELFETTTKYSYALASQTKKLYHRGRIPDYLNLSKRDLEGKSFVCDTDFTKYISFSSEGGTNPYKGLVQPDGSEKLQFYSTFYLKNGKYILKGTNMPDSSQSTRAYTAFSKVSNKQIKDDTTNETYTLFDDAHKAPKEVAWEKMGIEPPKLSYPMPKPKTKPQEEKTYDFADDQDDDYYDTYDDFDLNNGD